MKHTHLYTQKPPSILQLEVTKNCNNACIMCHKGQVGEGNDFDRTDIKELYIDQVKPVYPFLKHAMLFGDGEPMLYRGFWDIVKDIREASPRCCIDFINNGSMMHEKNIQKCLDYKVSHMGLSMGGATPETHNYIRKLSDFNKVIDNYKMLRDMKKERDTKEPYVGTLVVVMKSNLRELPDFVHLAAEMGWLSVEFQQMFITHPMVANEEVSSAEAEPIFEQCGKIAARHGLGFLHFPLESGKSFGRSPSQSLFNFKDPLFKPKYIGDAAYKGYCKFMQPWNAVYVLHDGKVVPDCHWWSSVRDTHLNECGQLSAHTNILDIWNGPIYQEIREKINKGQILPQCRGCGMAGGVTDAFRCEDTDHTSPEQEKADMPQLTQLTISVNPETEPEFQSEPEQPKEDDSLWIPDSEVREWYKQKQEVPEDESSQVYDKFFISKGRTIKSHKPKLTPPVLKLPVCVCYSLFGNYEDARNYLDFIYLSLASQVRCTDIHNVDVKVFVSERWIKEATEKLKNFGVEIVQVQNNFLKYMLLGHDRLKQYEYIVLCDAETAFCGAKYNIYHHISQLRIESGLLYNEFCPSAMEVFKSRLESPLCHREEDHSFTTDEYLATICRIVGMFEDDVRSRLTNQQTWPLAFFAVWNNQIFQNPDWKSVQQQCLDNNIQCDETVLMLYCWSKGIQLGDMQQQFNLDREGRRQQGPIQLLIGSYLADYQPEFHNIIHPETRKILPKCSNALDAMYCDYLDAAPAAHLRSSQSFDILTTSRNNVEWISSFLTSMSKTLYDKSRIIHICDGSNDDNYKLLQEMDHRGLNVRIHRMKGEQYHIKAVLHGLSFVESKRVCICDADTVLLQSGWDERVEMSPYDFVGIAPRTKNTAEAAFMCGDTDLILESKLEHADIPDKWGWDDVVMPRSVGYEHRYLTYLLHKYNKTALLFTEHKSGWDHFGKGWGTLVYDNLSREFLYHNFYSSRYQPDATGVIPEGERDDPHLQSIVKHCADNPLVLIEYFESVWPDSLVDFLAAKAKSRESE